MAKFSTRILLLVVAIILVAILFAIKTAIYRPGATLKDYYWSTIVGVERDEKPTTLLSPLSSKHLLGWKFIPGNHPTISELQLPLPFDILMGAVVAIYERDPHLNWRGPHLLHQGYIKKDAVLKIFPSLLCGIAPTTNESQLEEEETLLFIKPSSLPHTQEIRQMIQSANLSILKEWQQPLNEQLVRQFYYKHQGQSFFEELVQSLSGNVGVRVFVLRGEKAITRLRELVGATDPSLAATGTIRRRFGRDKTNNSVHASDSLQAVFEEMRIFCPLPSSSRK